MINTSQQATSTNLAPKYEPPKRTPREQCKIDGGVWDEKTQTCLRAGESKDPAKITIPKKDVEPSKLDVKQEGIEIGDIKGTSKQTATLPDGRQFFGLSLDDIDLLKQQEAGKKARLEGTAPLGTAQAQADIEQERARLTAEETPQRRELNPPTSWYEQIPLIGGLVSRMKNIVGIPLKKALGIPLSNIEFSPEELRTEALSEIERQEIERGLTLNEQFGSFIEAIPIVGSLASKYAGGLIETPSENAKQVKSNILKERRRITNIETNVKLGYLPVSVANEQIVDIENNVQRLESRIRMLINASPELRFNSDYVNTVETEILATREKAFQAKQNILTGATQDPTEIQLLKQLQLTNEDLE